MYHQIQDGNLMTMTDKPKSCIRFCLFKRIEKGYHYVHKVNKAKVKNKKTKYYRYRTYTKHSISDGYHKPNTFLRMLPSMTCLKITELSRHE